MSPALSSRVGPPRISIVAFPSRTSKVSRWGNVYVTGSGGALEYRDRPASTSPPLHKTCNSPPTSGSGSHWSVDRFDTKTPATSSMVATLPLPWHPTQDNWDQCCTGLRFDGHWRGGQLAWW